LERKLSVVPPYRFSAHIAHLLREEDMATRGKDLDAAATYRRERLELEQRERVKYQQFVDRCAILSYTIPSHACDELHVLAWYVIVIARSYRATQRGRLQAKQDEEMRALRQRNMETDIKTKRTIVAEYNRY
jgi:hypothetical protein